jgi:divalent metal cation (Fe/Co/Zn/Cd) transporter
MGLLLVLATGEEAFDPLAALALAAYMAWTTFGLVHVAVNEILDRALPEEEVEAIKSVLDSHRSEIRGYHRLRTRRSGSSREVDMHLLFDPARTVTDVHTSSDHIADEIHASLPGSVVVIHVEPDDGLTHESNEGWTEP